MSSEDASKKESEESKPVIKSKGMETILSSRSSRSSEILNELKWELDPRILEYLKNIQEQPSTSNEEQFVEPLDVSRHVECRSESSKTSLNRSTPIHRPQLPYGLDMRMRDMSDMYVELHKRMEKSRGGVSLTANLSHVCVVCKTSPSKTTFLIEAVRAQHEGCVDALIACGAEVNFKSTHYLDSVHFPNGFKDKSLKYHGRAIDFAIQNGRLCIINKLIDAGAKIRNFYMMMAIHCIREHHVNMLVKKDDNTKPTHHPPPIIAQSAYPPNEALD